MRDKFLTEAIIGLTKEWSHGTDQFRAIDFSTWEGFGKLWEWALKQEWFKEIPFNFDDNRYHDDYMLFPVDFIHPDRLADAVYEYLKAERNKV